MPTYTVQAPRVDVNPVQAGDFFNHICLHAGPLGYTITSVSLGTAANAGLMQLIVSRTLTAAELTHLGLA